MSTEQTKILIVFFVTLALLSFFISIGNECDLQRLRARHDSLQIDFDSLKISLECENVGWFLMDAKYGPVRENGNSNQIEGE